ncbi:hypothetical protein [Ensifer soli]|uniref:hypothetical protein n=1 Tax=Ciceribacter sp. sgz301302 TaxID=3342379 RepID=UPI0035BA7E84
MPKRILAILALVATGVLAAGCNSTDALTPQVDVGSGVSTPVTQADTERMASEPGTTVGRQDLPPATDTAGGRPQRPIARGADPTFRDGPGTLDGQAAALARGDAQPAATPQRTNPAPTAAAPAESSETIRFLPIIGAPVEAVTPLSRQLGADARAAGLTIRGASDGASRHMLKGYFSALSDGGKTTIVYVWDVLDASGNRLHRIQGQDTAGPASSNPWSGVPADTMRAIATKTIADYVAWKNGRAG